MSNVNIGVVAQVFELKEGFILKGMLKKCLTRFPRRAPVRVGVSVIGEKKIIVGTALLSTLSLSSSLRTFLRHPAFGGRRSAESKTGW